MKGWLAAFILAQGLDATTTCMAGADREANPLLPRNCAAIVGIKAGATTGTVVVLKRIERDHPRLAKVLTITLTAVSVGVVVHNVKEMR